MISHLLPQMIAFKFSLKKKWEFSDTEAFWIETLKK